MTETDRLKWDRKHAARQEPPTVNALVQQYAPEAPRGRALDLACGLGQNAIFLAGLGFAVDAVDISPVALARIDHPGIHTICADLDTYPIERACYSLIIVTFFLDRRLFPAIMGGLAPGGMLIYQTATRACQKMRNPAFKLASGELAQAFASLEITCDAELDGIASFVARKP